MSQKKEQGKRIKYCVLICQSLNSDYDNVSPFTEFGNYSAIDYTINWLVENDVQEIFMFYSNLKQQVQQYHQQFAKIIDAKLYLHYMKPTQLKNFGDVIREVHFRDLVSEDFLVLYADNISNINLSEMTQNHFDKKVELKNVVLTTATRKGLSSQIYVLNSVTNQILQIDNQYRKQFALNTQKINLKKLNVSVRRDIVPIDMFICTIQVVKSFKETYEYATMQDFIVGMLTSDVYEEKINVYQLKHTEVSYRLNKASSIYHCYMNYICGYLNPYTIYSEERMSKFQRNNSERSFTVGKFNKIFRKNLKISDSAVLSNNVYVGQSTKICDNCIINKSIIGKNCIINKNVHLKNCIILDGCTLTDNSNFQYSLIQKVHQTIKIHNFKAQIFEQFQKFIERDLFLETPEPQKSTFDEELLHLLSDKPEEETILVSELVRIRQQYSKGQGELVKEIISILKPQGVKGIQNLTQQWGPVLLKVHHQEEDNLINSLFYSCQNIENYLKAFHLFLQYFYHYQILTKETIIEWYNQNKSDNVTLNLCKAFLTNLEEQDEQEQEEENQFSEDK